MASRDFTFLTLRNVTAYKPDNSVVPPNTVFVTGTNGSANFSDSIQISTINNSTINTNIVNNSTINTSTIYIDSNGGINTNNTNSTNIGNNNGSVQMNGSVVTLTADRFNIDSQETTFTYVTRISSLYVSSIAVSSSVTTSTIVVSSIMPDSIVDENGSTGTAGQILSAGAGNSLQWVNAGSGGGGVTSVNSGHNITVDNTNITSPIINLNSSINISSLNAPNSANISTLVVSTINGSQYVQGVQTVASGSNTTVSGTALNPIVNLNSDITISSLTVSSITNNTLQINSTMTTSTLNAKHNANISTLVVSTINGSQYVQGVQTVTSGSNTTVSGTALNPIVNLNSDITISSLTVSSITNNTLQINSTMTTSTLNVPNNSNISSLTVSSITNNTLQINSTMTTSTLNVPNNSNISSLTVSTINGIQWVAPSNSLWAESGGNIYNTNSGGNVGIGNTTPAYKLDVTGDGRFNNLNVTTNLTVGTTTTNTVSNFYSNNNIINNENNAFANNLSFVKTNNNLTTDNESELGYVSFNGTDTNNIIRRAAYIISKQDGAAGNGYVPGSLNFYTNSNNVESQKMIINSQGNVGIGSSAPAYKLDVNGTGRFTDNLTCNSTLTVSTVAASTLNTSTLNTRLIKYADSNSKNILFDSGGPKYIYMNSDATSNALNLNDGVSIQGNNTNGGDLYLNASTSANGVTANRIYMNNPTSISINANNTFPYTLSIYNSTNDTPLTIDSSNATSFQMETRKGSYIWYNTNNTTGTGGGLVPQYLQLYSYFPNAQRILDIAPNGNISTFNNFRVGGNTMLAQGSAGAPSLTFSTDADTGLYGISDGQIGISANGSERMNITSNDITLTPRQSSIEGASGAVIISGNNYNHYTKLLLQNTSTTNSAVVFNMNSGNGEYSLYANGSEGAPASSGLIPSTFQIYSYFGGVTNNPFTMYPNGNTNIGTPNTTAINMLYGTTTISSLSVSSLNGLPYIPTTASYWTSGLNNSVSSNVSGNVGIKISDPQATLDVNGNLRLATGSAAAPSLFFQTDTDTGLYGIADGQMGISANGQQRILITTDITLSPNSNSAVNITSNSSGNYSRLLLQNTSNTNSGSRFEMATGTESYIMYTTPSGGGPSGSGLTASAFQLYSYYPTAANVLTILPNGNTTLYGSLNLSNNSLLNCTNVVNSLTAGAGIAITGGSGGSGSLTVGITPTGNITTTGNVTCNTLNYTALNPAVVTQLTAGTGISVSGSTGNVTVSLTAVTPPTLTGIYIIADSVNSSCTVVKLYSDNTTKTSSQTITPGSNLTITDSFSSFTKLSYIVIGGGGGGGGTVAGTGQDISGGGGGASGNLQNAIGVAISGWTSVTINLAIGGNGGTNGGGPGTTGVTGGTTSISSQSGLFVSATGGGGGGGGNGAGTAPGGIPTGNGYSGGNGGQGGSNTGFNGSYGRGNSFGDYGTGYNPLSANGGGGGGGALGAFSYNIYTIVSQGGNGGAAGAIGSGGGIIGGNGKYGGGGGGAGAYDRYGGNGGAGYALLYFYN